MPCTYDFHFGIPLLLLDSSHALFVHSQGNDVRVQRTHECNITMRNRKKETRQLILRQFISIKRCSLSTTTDYHVFFHTFVSSSISCSFSTINQVDLQFCVRGHDFIEDLLSQGSVTQSECLACERNPCSEYSFLHFGRPFISCVSDVTSFCPFLEIGTSVKQRQWNRGKTDHEEGKVNWITHDSRKPDWSRVVITHRMYYSFDVLMIRGEH